MTTRILRLWGSPIPAIVVVRRFYGVGLAGAKRLVTSLDALPAVETYQEEKRLREGLQAAGCTLADACRSCFDSHDTECLGDCYAAFTHASFYPPHRPDQAMAGSGYAFTTCCGKRPEPLPPRVHEGLSQEERQVMVAKVDCSGCLRVLKVWGLDG